MRASAANPRPPSHRSRRGRWTVHYHRVPGWLLDSSRRPLLTYSASRSAGPGWSAWASRSAGPGWSAWATRPAFSLHSNRTCRACRACRASRSRDLSRSLEQLPHLRVRNAALSCLYAHGIIERLVLHLALLDL